MQVSLDVTGPLERRVRVEIPEDQIAGEIASRLRDMAARANISGFRPGKAPMKVVARHFGPQIRGEVLGEVLRRSFQAVIAEQRLKPTGEPTIDPISAEPGQGMSYTATFEVYPEVRLAPVEQLQVQVVACTIEESDVDRMIETLRRQHRTFASVTRPAAMGDLLNIDFDGTIDGVAFEGGSAKGVDVELGSNRLMDGFETGLVGATAGADLSLDVMFPGNHPNVLIAGKSARFAVHVNSIKEPHLPPVDGALFEKFGVVSDSLDDFRAEVRRNMERERTDALRNWRKQAVLEALQGANPVPLPQSLVEREAQQLAEQMQRNLALQGRSVPPDFSFGLEAFQPEAQRRVALGLLLGEIIVTQGLRPDPAQVRVAVDRLASSYEDPASVVKWYYEDRGRLADIETAVLEDVAVQWVLDRAQVSERKVEFDALMNPRQTSANVKAA